MVISSQRACACARSHAPTICATSGSRPTNREPWLRSGASSTERSRYVGTDSDFPFSVSGSTGSATAASWTRAWVASPINTSPGVAACSSRAATSTASPVASRSEAPVTTSPVLTPIRPPMPTPAAHPASRPPPGRPAARRPRAPRNPEHRHHGVADELLHRAAVRIDDRLHPLEVAGKQHPDRLRVGRLPQRRRADDVAEQDGHDLALLRRPCDRRCPALGAELEGLSGPVAANSTSGHTPSLGTRGCQNNLSRAWSRPCSETVALDRPGAD